VNKTMFGVRKVTLVVVFGFVSGGAFLAPQAAWAGWTGWTKVERVYGGYPDGQCHSTDGCCG
jgi:hypothetical protein